MSVPELVVFLAFGDPPLTANGAATWVDVSDYVAGSEGIDHSIHRGRNHERDENEAGTAIIVLRNTDRRFDPTNSSGPYLGQIRPMTKIRIGANWLSNLYWLFTGYVESWTPEYHGGSVATCTLECVDATKYFGLSHIYTYGNRPQEASGARIDAALDAVSWPAGERSIAAGDIQVAALPLDDSALGIIRQVTQAERGSFYLSRHGTATFEDRSWRDTAASVGLWGDAADGSQLPYASVTTRYDDSDIFNRIEVTRTGGIMQTVNDSTSQTDYFVRTFRSSGLPYVDDAAALLAAQTMGHRYKDARFRLERMVIDPGVRDTWLDVVELELSDMITVWRSTLIDGHHVELDAHIEAIDWRMTKGLWLLTLQLSPHFLTGALAGTLNTADDWIEVAGGIGYKNGWADLGGINLPVAYRREGDWVYVRGLATGGTVGTSGSTMFTLPVGYRPSTNVFLPVIASAAPGMVGVQTDGDVPAISGTNTYFDLSTIRFRVI